MTLEYAKKRLNELQNARIYLDNPYLFLQEIYELEQLIAQWERGEIK